ncbi:MAG: hypothetical protein AVDCRST_MAG13-928, partial [uncultured Solirubrobacteraceae bacterium]
MALVARVDREADRVAAVDGLAVGQQRPVRADAHVGRGRGREGARDGRGGGDEGRDQAPEPRDPDDGELPVHGRDLGGTGGIGAGRAASRRRRLAGPRWTGSHRLGGAARGPHGAPAPMRAQDGDAGAEQSQRQDRGPAEQR